MLIALSSTRRMTSPLCCLSPDADPTAGVPVERSSDAGVSGVSAAEASMKVIGVMRELGVRESGFRGRSK